MPNLVVIYADDLRYDLMQFMPQTLARFKNGFHFNECRLNVCVCGPARAGFITGQYALRSGNGVYANADDLPDDADDTLLQWLQDESIECAFFGKHYNAVATTGAPGGWDYQRGLVPQQQDRYGFSVSNGTSEITDPEGHVTAYLRDAFTDYIENTATPDFFAWVCPTDPHVSIDNAYRPVPEFQYANARPLHNAYPLDLLPSDADKPTWISDLSEAGAAQQAELQGNIHRYLKVMKGLDDLVESVFAVLDSEGLTSTTDVIFTSDGGVHFGEQQIHGMVIQSLSLKNTAYDVAMKVPLLAVGPNFPAGSSDIPTTGQDIAATAIDLFGATASITQDGISLFDIIADQDAYDDRELLHEREEGAVGNITTYPAGSGITTGLGHTYPHRKLYHYPGETGDDEFEMYDLDTDPDEHTNVANVPARSTERDALETALDTLLGI